jgi:hypothetical protein
MASAAKPKVLDDLKREVGRIAAGSGAFHDVSKPNDYRAFAPAPVDSRLKQEGRTAAPAERGPFGSWLLEQFQRDDMIGQLAQAARRDPAFPRNGDPVAVRKRMSAQGADPDMHEALDDAELDWCSL